MSNETVFIGTCPDCGHCPTQFIAMPDGSRFDLHLRGTDQAPMETAVQECAAEKTRALVQKVIAAATPPQADFPPDSAVVDDHCTECNERQAECECAEADSAASVYHSHFERQELQAEQNARMAQVVRTMDADPEASLEEAHGSR